MNIKTVTELKANQVFWDGYMSRYRNKVNKSKNAPAKDLKKCVSTRNIKKEKIQAENPNLDDKSFNLTNVGFYPKVKKSNSPDSKHMTKPLSSKKVKFGISGNYGLLPAANKAKGILKNNKSRNLLNIQSSKSRGKRRNRSLDRYAKLENQKTVEAEEREEKRENKKRRRNFSAENRNQNLVLELDHLELNFIHTKIKKKKDPSKIIKKIKNIHDLSKTGQEGDEWKINQDRYFIFRNFLNNNDIIFLGVCDGHGQFGNEVSEYLKENLPNELNHQLKNCSATIDTPFEQIEKVIQDCFVEQNNKLINYDRIDTRISGSTCLSTIYSPEKLIIANVGDSRCLLGRFDGQNWIGMNLSRDHKPEDEDEKKRILENGGEVRQGIYDGESDGPFRVYIKGQNLPGLAMTRSFGDQAATLAGTISKPEVKEYKWNKDDKFFILASDGLFEYITTQQIVQMVGSFYEKEKDIVECCEYLYGEAYKKWIKEEEDAVDDITLIVVFLQDEED